MTRRSPRFDRSARGNSLRASSTRRAGEELAERPEEDDQSGEREPSQERDLAHTPTEALVVRTRLVLGKPGEDALELGRPEAVGGPRRDGDDRQHGDPRTHHRVPRTTR